MNKMVINHLEKLFVTNDAATILRELEVNNSNCDKQELMHIIGGMYVSLLFIYICTCLFFFFFFLPSRFSTLQPE